MFNTLTIVRLLFLIEIFIAEGIFTLKLKKRKHFILYNIISLIVFASWVIFFPMVDGDELFLKIIYGVLMLFPMWLFSIITLFLCYDEKKTLLFLIAIAGFTVQKIGSLVNSLISLINPELLNLERASSLNIWIFLNIFISDSLVFVGSYFIFAKNFEKNQNAILNNKTLYLISLVAAFSNLFFGMIYTFGASYTTIINTLVNYLQNLLCCILVMILLTGILQIGETNRELELNKKIYSLSEFNYKNEKKQIEIINQKCHDLKHRVMELMTNNNANYNDILEDINIYDNSFHTNNEALDIVFAQKSLVCKKNNIVISAMVDANSLSFMKSSDIFVLFGNLFDNAINALNKINDDKEKILYVNIFTKANMLLIKFENRFNGIVNLENGEYKTTNDDKDNHGYGIKGIKDIVNLYDGIIEMSSNNNIFITKISFIIK